MKLLLDEMHTHLVAKALSERGYDVVAVVLDPGLRGVSDADLLAFAASSGRAVVTENVGDYMRLHRLWTAEGRAHAGLVFTHPKSYPRAFRSYPGDLTAALERMLSTRTPDGDSWVIWL